jgi:hypothetical protein
MKFIHYLERITGVEVYPMMSLMIFFFFFVFVAIYLIKAKKDDINEVKNIPLDPEN